MGEILARVSQEKGVELVDDRSRKIEGIGSMTPEDAAYLARGMLALAATLPGPNPPEVGTLGGDAHLPVAKWAVGASAFTGKPILLLTLPSGIELSFAIWPDGAKGLGTALIKQAEGSPLQEQSGTIH
jgi:hypothetical protein